jgi:hypothetical protein
MVQIDRANHNSEPAKNALLIDHGAVCISLNPGIAIATVLRIGT